MTLSKFEDKFDRVDGEVGDNYLIPCGSAGIFDESVWPVDSSPATGLDLLDTTIQKTQVLMSDELDSPDMQVRAVWSHLDSLPEFDLDIDEIMTLATEDPSFTILARMTKDPMLVDLGVDEDPLCYDQGYGLRVTCPRNGNAPILKLVKYMPRGLPPGVAGKTTISESDDTYVLTSLTLGIQNLNVDPSQDTDSTDPPAYRGFVQSMKLRIRRSDDHVILEGYLNDRNQDVPVISYTDIAHPIWGDQGRAGFEFISATSASQATGASPFLRSGIPVMACHLFLAEVVLDLSPAYASSPGNLMTYERVVTRVIALVEKNGDSRYNATTSGQTKIDTYLDFVLEAEREILREEGHFRWLWRERDMVLTAGTAAYELPEDLGELGWVAPSSYQGTTLQEIESGEFQRRFGGSKSVGQPRAFTRIPAQVNNRTRIKFYPNPSSGYTVSIGYFARLFHPQNPSGQIPNVPQEDIDVLVYGAAAHALLLDTDAQNAQIFSAIYEKKLDSLRRKNNRNQHSYQTVFSHISDSERGREIPQLRSTSISRLL